jgi:hypothetical protein
MSYSFEGTDGRPKPSLLAKLGSDDEGCGYGGDDRRSVLRGDPLRTWLARRGIELICPHRKNRRKDWTHDCRQLRRYKRQTADAPGRVPDVSGVVAGAGCGDVRGGQEDRGKR